MKAPWVLAQVADTGHSCCRRAGAVLALSFLLSVFIGGCGVTERVSKEARVGPCRGDYGPLFDRVSELLVSHPDLRASSVREGLIRALGDSRDPSAYSVLVRILLDGEPLQVGEFRGGEWHEAAHALARIGDPRALRVLQEAIAAGRLSPQDGVRAIGALAVIGENVEALDYVVRALEGDQDESVRRAAARALYAVNPKQARATAALERAARSDASMRVRVAAACVLIVHGDRGYWSFLKSAAADPDADVREDVADQVPFCDEAVPLLLALLADENRNVAGAAWEPLEKHLPTDFPSPPQTVESGRKMAEVYRKAWTESRHK